MQLKQKPEGYMFNIESHAKPAQSPPVVKMSQQKEQGTLMGNCLKSLIKERMFGNLNNYIKNSEARKLNFTPMDNFQGGKSSQNNFKRQANSFQETPRYQLLDEMEINLQQKNTLKQKVQSEVNPQNLPKLRLIHRSSLDSKFQQNKIKSLIRSQRGKNNKSALSNINNRYPSDKYIDNSLENDNDKYQGSSFLSAIDQSIFKRKTQQLVRKHQKLVPVANQKDLVKKLQQSQQLHVQVRKSAIRVQSEKLSINPQIWNIFQFYSSIKQTEKNAISNLTPMIPKQLSALSKLTQGQSEKRTTTKGLDVLKLANILKTNFISSKTYFMKQNFIGYLNDHTYVNTILANLTYVFFEIGTKIADQMKSQDYLKIAKLLFSTNPRVWAILAFRFWDTDRNGTICSNDIFKMYQHFDKIQQLLKENAGYENSQGYKHNKILRELLEELRSLILEIKLQNQLKRKVEQKKKHDNFKNMQVKYLEQALISKKDLKYSDLLLIFGNSISTNNKNINESVIETKKIGVKFSSCYRYSFLATDHNQETREGRQCIQKLRQNLKRQKITAQENEQKERLEQPKYPGIDYSRFLEGEYYLKIRQICLQMFGVQSIL